MSGWWLASYAVLWVAVFGLGFVLLVSLRELGLVYARLRTSGGVQLEEGPPVGKAVPAFIDVDAKSGRTIRFPDVERMNLLLFSAPHCSLCKEPLRQLRHGLSGRDVRAFVISSGDEESNAPLQELVDGAAAFVASRARQLEIGIDEVPYAIVTDKKGVVLAKSVVNDLDALDEVLDQAQKTSSNGADSQETRAAGRMR
jgi:methylamine dehydrogenase accessory protein MauD